VAQKQNGRGSDPGARAILAELRDLRVEMRADRRQAEEERREERRRSDARFEQLLAASARREVAMRRVFGDVRTVGVAIVRAVTRQTRVLQDHGRILRHHGEILEHHTRILERIDRNLGARRHGPPRQDNGRRG